MLKKIKTKGLMSGKSHKKRYRSPKAKHLFTGGFKVKDERPYLNIAYVNGKKWPVRGITLKTLHSRGRLIPVHKGDLIGDTIEYEGMVIGPTEIPVGGLLVRIGWPIRRGEIGNPFYDITFAIINRYWVQ